MKRISESTLRRLIQLKLTENFRRKLLKEQESSTPNRDAQAAQRQQDEKRLSVSDDELDIYDTEDEDNPLLRKEVEGIPSETIAQIFLSRLNRITPTSLGTFKTQWETDSKNYKKAMPNIKSLFEALLSIGKCHAFESEEERSSSGANIKMSGYNFKTRKADPTLAVTKLVPLTMEPRTYEDIINLYKNITTNTVDAAASIPIWYDIKNKAIYIRLNESLCDTICETLEEKFESVKETLGDEDWIDYLEGDITNIGGNNAVWPQENRWYAIKLYNEDIASLQQIKTLIGIKAAQITAKALAVDNQEIAKKNADIAENKCKIEEDELRALINEFGKQLKELKALKGEDKKQEGKEQAQEQPASSTEASDNQAQESGEIKEFIVPRLNGGYYELAEILVDDQRLKQCFPKSVSDETLQKLANTFKTAGLGNAKKVIAAFTAEGENSPKFLKQGETISLGNIAEYGNGKFPNIIAANSQLKNRIKLDDWLKARGKKKINNSNVPAQNTKRQPSQDKIEGNRIVNKLVKNVEQNEKRKKDLDDILNNNGFENNSDIKYPKYK